MTIAAEIEPRPGMKHRLSRLRFVDVNRAGFAGG